MPMVGKLVIFDSKSGSVSEIPVPNREPHSVIVNPAVPRQALVLDQARRTAALVDLVDKKVIAETMPAKAFSFSGHGCYSADGKILYLAEFPSDLSAQGHVTLRDPKSLKILRSFKTGTRWSHNVALIKKGDVLAVGHRGSTIEENKPNSGGLFTFLSARTGEILERVEPENSRYFLNHFDMTADETILISTQSYYGSKEKIVDLPTPIMIGKMGQKMPWNYIIPDSLRPRMLHNHSIVVDRMRNRALLAHQGGGLVSVWDLATNTVIKTFELQTPQGIAISPGGDHYVLGSQSNKTLFVNAHSLELELSLPGSHFGISGDGPLHFTIVPAIS